jgi:hypothetical protein
VRLCQRIAEYLCQSALKLGLLILGSYGQVSLLFIFVYSLC